MLEHLKPCEVHILMSLPVRKILVDSHGPKNADSHYLPEIDILV